MSAGGGGITRRGLLAGLAGGVAATAIGPRRGAAAAARARVVRVESTKVWTGDVRDPGVVAAMVDAGVMALARASTREAGWRHFVGPGMRVGLKINLLGRPFVYTAPELTDAVAAGVITAGVRPADVIVWDRWRDHFGPTRYRFGRGRHGESVEAGGRYDAARALKGSEGAAPVDTLATERTDATISLPVLKDHGTSGVTLALKNVAFGCYDHYRGAHEHNCDPYIAEAYRHFVSVTRVPLIVMDATEACCDGGPRPADRGRLWRENAVYVADDPVALDVVGRRLIAAKRAARGLPDTTRAARHIETAIRMGLGVGDPSRIDLVTVTV